MTIAPEVDLLLATDPDADLIVNGRYMIVPADSKDLKAKPHSRVTNFSRELEDTFALVAWQKRMTLLGVAQRSDIAVAALADSDNKTKLNDLAEKAMDAARANAARETGSALHRLCERMDAGEVLELPEPWVNDLVAYQACLEANGIKILPEFIEGVVVCPDLGLAGRFDRIVSWRGERLICDLKTGADLSYSWGSIAVQLALYARAATIYDPTTRKHTPMPTVSQEFGIVVHLPAGQGKATLHLVDLTEGRRGIELIQAVKKWRKEAVQFVCEPGAVPDHRPASPELRAYVLQRVSDLVTAGHAADLARLWPTAAGVPTLKAFKDHTEAELDLILDVVAKIEGIHQMPFPPPDPRIPSDQALKQKKA